MASGDIVVQILEEIPPGSSAAVWDRRVGASSPPETYSIYKFADAVSRYMDFKCVLSGYAGGGLTLTLLWSSSVASGNVVVGAAIRRLAFDSDDVDVSHSYDYNSITDAAPGTSGHVTNPTISFTDGADMDDWGDGELAIIRIWRDGGNGSDSMTGDFQLWGIVGQET